MNKLGLKGLFNIVKKDKSGQVLDTYQFENLILDSGLDLVGNNLSGMLLYCHVGSGNSEAHVKQTQLDNLLSKKGRNNNNTYEWQVTDKETAKITKVSYRFDANEATGNISEIGIGTNGILFCRTLIKDSTGQPTVITKLADEILEVQYTLKLLIDTDDMIGQAMIGGEMYDYTLRLALRNSGHYNNFMYGGKISNIDGSPSTTGGYQEYIANRFSVYEPSSHKIGVSSSATIDQANFATGVRSVMFQSLFEINYQCEFRRVSDGSAIPKNNTQTLTLNFEQSWGRGE